jgi:hypothetical protein
MRLPGWNQRRSVVVGIVSVLDIMRWLARTDGYLVRQPINHSPQ